VCASAVIGAVNTETSGGATRERKLGTEMTWSSREKKLSRTGIGQEKLWELASSPSSCNPGRNHAGRGKTNAEHYADGKTEPTGVPWSKKGRSRSAN
jgi:hypothetical protein